MKPLNAYIPMDRRQALSKGEILPDRTTGAALFADVSGFTPLAQAFTKEMGPHRGAEALLDVINPVYEALITPLHRYGGSVISFAGDAITCWLDAQDGSPTHRAVASALAMQAAMQPFTGVQTLSGTPVDLSVKVTIATGPARRFLVGDPTIQQMDALAGATLARVAAAEQRAQRGEIVASAEVVQAMGESVTVAEWRGDFALIIRLNTEVATLPPPADVTLPPDTQRSWVLPALYDSLRSGSAEVGSLRPVTPLFIGFDGIDYDGDDEAGAQLNIFVRHVQHVIHQHGGSLMQLIIGDKGAYTYAVFGAPVVHEDDPARALRATLAIRDLLPDQTAVSNVRMGLTRGNLWAGECGARSRRTYAVMGSDVNLSVRLMERAQSGQILVSQRLAATRGFNLTLLGDWQYKGFANPLPTYELCGKRLHKVYAFTEPMVGRETELHQLANAAQPLFDDQWAGVALVYGDAGIGKSRIAYALRERLDERVTWFTGQTDQILRQAFNPFIYWLKRYFDQSAEATVKENKSRFEERFDQLVEALEGIDDIPADLVVELTRTRSFLGALLGFHWPDSLYEQLDADLRHRNATMALKTLLLAESCRRPVVFELEDGHWLDDASQELLLSLSRNMEDYPLLLLITSRYTDDGSRPSFTFAPDTPTLALDLEPLPLASLRQQAETILDGSVTDALLILLQEKTQANPFFAQQVLYYFQENDLLEQNQKGVWGLKTATTSSDIPASVNAILVARVDRLTQRVKEIVQTASVLGREFEVQILSQMLQADVLPQVQYAEREQIWLAMAELRYLFKHALLRDAAYEMQLRKRLRELHRLAAMAYEHIYADELRPYYADLVYHHRQAQDPAQERHYAVLAGKSEAEAGSYDPAVEFLSRALDLTPAGDVAGRYDLLLKREDVHHLQGAREAQRADLEALEQLVGLTPSEEGEEIDESRAAKVAWRQARYADAISDYDAAIAAAQRAVQLAQGSTSLIEAARARRVWGSALEYRGEYLAAQGQYRQGIAAAEAADTSVAASAARVINLRGLGVVAWDLGDYDAARNYYEQALVISREIGDRREISGCFHNLGGVAYVQGDYATAREYYERSLAIFQEIGDRWRASFCLNNLGVIALNLGDYATARRYYEQVWAIGEEIGDREGLSRCLDSLGDISIVTGDYAAASSYLCEALSIAQEIGSRMIEGLVFNKLGNLALLQDQPDESMSFYQQALAIRTELGQAHYLTESQAGIALAALTQGDEESAQAYARRVLDYLQENPTLDGTENAIRTFHFTWQVLMELAHPQAEEVLATGAQVIQAQVDKISDPEQRQMYLAQPHHRTLWQAWQESEQRG